MSSIIGLFSGEDIEILEFRPPPMTFEFDKDIKILVWSPPSIYVVLGFAVEATLEVALVRMF